jgi:hypothetical protein
MSSIGYVTIDAGEHAPGFRLPEAQKGFYAACLRDRTGNKLCIFCPV